MEVTLNPLPIHGGEDCDETLKESRKYQGKHCAGKFVVIFHETI